MPLQLQPFTLLFSYEGDADVGAREFGLKMTDRVNMRMAGVVTTHAAATS